MARHHSLYQMMRRITCAWLILGAGMDWNGPEGNETKRDRSGFRSGFDAYMEVR